MRRKKAFTLIELLVVIAIIALLMSILMPALKMVKEQAQTIMCLSNLRQVGAYWVMYTGDYDNSFNEGRPRGEGTNYWTRALEDYYGGRGNMDVFCCPKADKMREIPQGSNFVAGSTEKMWRFHPDRGENFRVGDYGSYGKNSWTTNPAAGIKFNYQNYTSTNTKWNWRYANVDKADMVPLMSECIWPVGWPVHWAQPPQYDEGWSEGVAEEQWTRWRCLNRHQGYAGAVFVDSHARRIGLKEVWELRWHRDWYWEQKEDGPQYAPPDWPEWMKDFKDYARY